jgi:hypothetical protein
MKKINLIYWVSTGLLAVGILASSIPDLIMAHDAVVFMKDHLGYPTYFIAFIGNS